ncbi:amidase [Mycolicibacterium baixiangningiae]|uniref:amidase n=1 Tax=Mycolicibacterium baixiangningiae TaxID=2761578 RepID=UPI0018670C0D|nr:amidase [Mycolicibacterium baixiangningiae]
MSEELLDTPAEALRSAYRTGEVTPQDILEHTLDRINRTNPVINALAFVAVESARDAARASGERWAAGTPRSPLDGLPVTIKDSVHATGMPWRHGCAANRHLPDSTGDAPPAARLKEAGAVIVGKTTMPDFGMMAAGVSSLYGITRNPWDPSRNTGGSSSGAGASLAAGIGFSAVGSDIAGSVRLPAGHCGLVALKPTQGRIPHLAPSTVRSAGPMARTADDVMDLYDVLSRPDDRDLWSLAPEVGAMVREPLLPNGLRIGVLTELGYGAEVADDVRAVLGDAADALRDGGATVSTMAPVFTEDAHRPLDRMFQVRALAELHSIPSDRHHLVHPAIRQWCAPAGQLSATDLARDTDAVARSAERMRSACAAYDFVIAPVIPVVGFAADACGVDPAKPLGHCGFTAWFNQTAQPASALCFGRSDGMPVGIQVIGPRFADRDVLRLTKWLEARRPFTLDWPVTAAQTAGGRP